MERAGDSAVANAYRRYLKALDALYQASQGLLRALTQGDLEQAEAMLDERTAIIARVNESPAIGLPPSPGDEAAWDLLRTCHRRLQDCQALEAKIDQAFTSARRDILKQLDRADQALPAEAPYGLGETGHKLDITS